MMQRHRTTRTKPLSKAQKKCDREIRAKYAHKPSLAEVLATGDYTAPVKQGAYLSLMKFAAAIKAARKAQSLSLSNLSKRSGIDKAAISQLESGLIEDPTFSTLERIAAALGKHVRITLYDARRAD